MATCRDSRCCQHGHPALAALPAEGLEDVVLLLLLLLPGVLLVMLRALEHYERMIDAPPKSERRTPPPALPTVEDDVATVPGPRARSVSLPAAEPVTELA